MKLRTHHTTCCFGLSIIVFLLFSMVACAPVAPETSDPAEQATATPTVEGDTPTPEPTEEETGLPEQPLPPPEICTPDAPRLSPIEEITSEPSEFDDSIFTINARYTNPEKDQQFQLKVSSQDPERADEFLGKLRVCFEAITTDMQAGLLTTDTDPETNRQLALSFLRETERNVLVEMEWLSGQERQEENLFVIYYLIDPTIDADGSDGYRAKCVKSARCDQICAMVAATLPLRFFGREVPLVRPTPMLLPIPIQPRSAIVMESRRQPMMLGLMAPPVASICLKEAGQRTAVK